MLVKVPITSHTYQTICGKSIQWILNWRSLTHRNDNHTDASLNWTKQQSRIIDETGWESWLKSPRAFGYNWHLQNKNKNARDIARISTNNTN